MCILFCRYLIVAIQYLMRTYVALPDFEHIAVNFGCSIRFAIPHQLVGACSLIRCIEVVRKQTHAVPKYKVVQKPCKGRPQMGFNSLSKMGLLLSVVGGSFSFLVLRVFQAVRSQATHGTTSWLLLNRHCAIMALACGKHPCKTGA